MNCPKCYNQLLNNDETQKWANNSMIGHFQERRKKEVWSWNDDSKIIVEAPLTITISFPENTQLFCSKCEKFFEEDKLIELVEKTLEQLPE